jgi:hypothetical protein
MFDAEDKVTIALNCTLLFLVLFFVYPLKFVFTNVIGMMSGNAAAFRNMTVADHRVLFLVYSTGFVAMFAIFVLLYWNMYKRRHALGLNQRQAFEAKAGARTHLVSIAVGIASIVMALTVPIQWIWTAGAIYGLQGPLHWRNGVLLDRARQRAVTAAAE